MWNSPKYFFLLLPASCFLYTLLFISLKSVNSLESVSYPRCRKEEEGKRKTGGTHRSEKGKASVRDPPANGTQTGVKDVSRIFLFA